MNLSNKNAKRNLIGVSKIILLILILGFSFISTAEGELINTTEDNLIEKECIEGADFKECVYDGGKKSLEVYAPRIKIEEIFLPINFSLNYYNQDGYAYKTNLTPYEFYVKEVSNYGDGMKYCVDGQCLIYQAQDQSFRNKDGSQDYISSILGKNINKSSNIVRYDGVFPEVSLEYTTDYHQVKENFILHSKPRAPQSWLGDVSNVTLDFGGYIKFGNLRMFVDGIEKTNNDFVTGEKIEFKNSSNDLVFYLPSPHAEDSNGDRIDIEYEVKKQGDQIWFYTRTPFEWLNDSSRVYPVYVDPSLEVTSGTTSLGGDLEYDYVSVAEGAILQINGTGYLNITALEYITIIGTVNGKAVGGAGGGGCIGNCYDAGQSGAGIGGGGGGGWYSPTSSTGGGGGAGHSSSGQGGGSEGSASGGAGGISYGSSVNREITIGSGGGSGAVASGSRGGGGAGGGGLKLRAPQIIINGSIDLSASNGGNGDATLSAGGGGGGSGGSFVMEAQNIKLNDSNIDLRGGSGGAGDGGGGSGGAGSGGRIKIFYETSFLNQSMVFNTGTYYTEQVSDLGFNTAPSLETNETIPSVLDFGFENNYINITTSDADNDSIDSVYFWITKPNGTILIDGINGTFISGDSSLGQSEEWHSPFFNITNETSSVGTWTWNVTIQGNGTTENGTYLESFILTDNISPGINITNPFNNSIIYQNVSVKLNYTYYDNIEVDSCLYSLDEGATNVTLVNCQNTTFGAEEGNYNLSLFVNDTSNNLVSLKYNVSIEEDNTNPSLSIITPSNGSTINSLTVPVSISAFDLGDLNYCYYNITRGASLEVSNTQIPDCSSITATVSSDASYILNVFVNDTTGNINTTSSSFAVDTTTVAPPSGGGGGSTIVIGGGAEWEVTTETGATSYTQIIPQEASKNLPLLFENLGETSVTISMTCEDTIGNLCQYVSYSQQTFELPLQKEIKQRIDVFVDIPENVAVGDYKFNIIAIDNLNNRGSTTYNIAVNNGILAKITSSYDVFGLRIPYLLILLLSSILSTIVIYNLGLKKTSGGAGISFLLGLIIGVVVILLL